MTKPTYPIKPEVMSPAGYWPQLHAAIEAGADAVYFGLKHFTARAKVGFGLEELPDVMRTLHRRGVKGYVTFNTLIFDHELSEAAKSLAAIAATGVDAIIVQDVGVAQLAHQIAPDLDIHGSTQMSITSAEGIELARQFGVSRVVLARELSLAEIRTIRSQTDCELEMFVHGALCVSYSGQCFSSEAWGGRSANRGQCAQACRLPYEMLVDDVVKPLGDARYLLSPGDLYALQQIPEIVPIGVHALKIEGRYKDADYVALTTAAYRKAVDEAWAGLPLSVTPAEEVQLEQVYSRGLGPWFISGTNHQTAVKGRSPRHRGVLMGMVKRVTSDSVIITPDPAVHGMPLKPGDGVVFDAADWRSPEEREEGGRIYEIATMGDGHLEVRFGNGAIHFKRIRPGDLLWRSHDPDLDKVARPFTQASSPVHKQPLRVHVTAHEGQPLCIDWALVERPDIQVTVISAEPLPAAQHRALDLQTLHEQLGRLGNTAYTLAELTAEITGHPFVASSLLNQLRRQAVEHLVEVQGQAPQVEIADPQKTLESALKRVIVPVTTVDSTTDKTDASLNETRRADLGQGAVGINRWQAQLHLLVRTPEQLEAALALHPTSITLDYLELYGLRPAVEQVQAAGITARVASPRVLKPNEQRIVNFLLRLGCEIVVRSSGLLQALTMDDGRQTMDDGRQTMDDGRQTMDDGADQPSTVYRLPFTAPSLIGDFSLNAANVLTADTFLKLGLQRLTPTFDLNAAQVAALARSIGPDKIEVVAYQHLPVFHTEHCLFCRFLSSGTSYKDCGHPCETHKVALRDTNGRTHPVMADVGCRNTVFGAEAQEASQHLDLWRQAGIQHYRLEFVHETGEEVTKVAKAFTRTLAGKQASAELTRQLKSIAPQGTTAGSLFVAENYMEIPLMS